jgi:hypothetical protein
MNLQRKFKKNLRIFPFCSPTERGAAEFAEPMGEELQEGEDKREKHCKPFAVLCLFTLQLQLFF